MATTTAPYDVVVLIEQTLTAGDATRIVALHEGLRSEQGAEVRYHLLLPVDDAAARVHAAMGSFAGADPLPAPPPEPEVQQALLDSEASHARADLDASLRAMSDAGAQVGGETVDAHPIDALRTTVAEVGAREAVVVTARHVVAEFFSVDWASQAERHLGIPVLHLVEHESFAEQAGDGGVTGL